MILDLLPGRLNRLQIGTFSHRRTGSKLRADARTNNKNNKEAGNKVRGNCSLFIRLLINAPLDPKHFKHFLVHYGSVTEEAFLAEELAVVGSHDNMSVRRNFLVELLEQVIEVLDV